MTLELHCDGQVDLSERTHPDGTDMSTTKLVEITNPDGLELRVYYPCDETAEKWRVGVVMDCHHMRNKETGRIFHTHLDIVLDWEDIELLHRYFALLMTIKRTRQPYPEP
jgi:hypothetical protein